MRLDALLPDITLDAAVANCDVNALCYDSRRVQPGSLFFAWAGGRQDGHLFVAEAVARGAVAVVCGRAVDAGAVSQVVVDDVRYTMAQVARRFYGDPAAHMRMVGITGTNGKTSVAHLVEGMLQGAGLAAGIIGTLGARFARPATPSTAATCDEGLSVPATLTTPESVDLVALLARMRAAGVGGVAMEVSSQALDQKRPAGVAFDVAVFTNLTHDHLDYHGSLDAYFAAKASLFRRHLKAAGRAVLNFDDSRVRSLAADAACGALPPLTFSATFRPGMPATPRPPEIYLEECTLLASGTHLSVHTPRGLCTVDSELIGAFNVANILAAVAVGEALQLPLDAISAGLGAVVCVPGRLQRIARRAHEPLVVVDYAHTPDALRQALRAVRPLTSGRLFCVFGCGGDRDPHKRAPMGRAAYHGADWSVVTDDNPRGEDPAAIAAAIVGGLQAAGGHSSAAPSAGGYTLVHDRRAAIARAIDAASVDDCVLIAGKGHETYQIVGAVRREFDDRLQARRALDARPRQASDQETP
jgi:UDP-N-acetylmuramoyl-L-alanyl-D-glutamate--2,6-diaminopimelate ligase